MNEDETKAIEQVLSILEQAHYWASVRPARDHIVKAQNALKELMEDD